MKNNVKSFEKITTLPSVFGDNHFVGEFLEFAPEITFLQWNAAFTIDARIAWIVFDVAAVTDHCRESAFSRWQNMLMSGWIAGHDWMSVLMRVLERRLVHFKAHPWPARTGQVFKFDCRFNFGLQHERTCTYTKPHEIIKTGHDRMSTMSLTMTRQMNCCLYEINLWSHCGMKKNKTIFFFRRLKNFDFLNFSSVKVTMVRRRTWMVEDSWGSCFTQPPFYWLGRSCPVYGTGLSHWWQSRLHPRPLPH